MNHFQPLLAFAQCTPLPLSRFSSTQLPPVCNSRKVHGSNRALYPKTPFAQLSPPNKEVDWIFVDTVVKGQAELVPEALERDIQDDAMTLIRVARRDAPTELSVVLCDDREISELNSRWRGIDKFTDVLSFPQDDPDKVLLGDIVISVETAKEQAAAREYDVKDEIRVLLVHGLLHLMGYDHEGAVEGDWLVVSYEMNGITLLENEGLTT